MKSGARKTLLWEHPFCFWCQCPLDESDSTVDHIIPRSRGGGNKLSNLVLACHPCNNKRGNPLISDEAAQIIREEYHRRAHQLSPARFPASRTKKSQRKLINEHLSKADWVKTWNTWYSDTYGDGDKFGERLNIV